MKHVLLVEHAPGRADGFLNFVKEHGVDVNVVVWQCYEDRPPPDIDGFDGMILSGGPQMVRDLERNSPQFYKDEKRYISEARLRNMLVLGVCLGSQILYHFFGGIVDSGKPIIGWENVIFCSQAETDPLFNGLDILNTLRTFQLHRDHLYDPGEKIEVLAHSSNSLCETFKVLDKLIYGCVFHPEIEVRQAQSIFDAHGDIFHEHQITRSDLAPLDDGREMRHRILMNFFTLILKNS